MKRVLAFSAAILLFLTCAPLRAQFVQQQTYISSSGGTNAITVLLANVTQLSDLQGVPLRILVTNTITGASTLTVNSLAPVTVQKKTPSGLAATIAGDVVNGQIGIFTYDGTVFELEGPQLNLATVPATNGFVAPINLQLNCTAAANALTCAIKAANTGADPTVNNPVYVPFADGTTTSGDPIWKTITAAQSFTFAGGNTAGCVSGSPCRLWITEINDTTAITGTVRLGLSNQSTASAIFPLNEAVLQSTGTGTSGGNSAGTIYTSAASLSGMAIRIVGYVEWTTLATAGNWTAPNFVRLFGPGVKKPGEEIQRSFVGLSGNTAVVISTTGTTNFLTATGLTATLTPTSAANLVEIMGTINGGISATVASGYVRLSRGSSTGICTGSGAGAQPSAGAELTTVGPTDATSASLMCLDQPGATSTSYNWQVSGPNSGSFYVGRTTSDTNNSGNGRFFSYIQAREIMGALEPSNDNGLALSKAG